MRPIDKGSWPTKGLKSPSPQKKVFNDWTRAIPHLTGRTGRYCHLCEMKVTNAIAIEHIQPKERFPELAADWDNFLLVCNYCNSHKLGSVPDDPYQEKYYWPHLNNTLLAFDFKITGEIVPNEVYLRTAPKIDRAKATIKLYGLDKTVTSQGNSDDRLKERLEAYKQAIDRFIEYSKGVSTIKAIIDNAKNIGFFSVWLKVFDGEPTVREALINCPEFHLATTGCFDATLKLKERTATDL